MQCSSSSVVNAASVTPQTANEPGAVVLAEVQNPVAKQVLAAFDLNGDKVVTTAEAPADVLGLVRGGLGQRPSAKLVPVVERIGSGQLTYVDLAAVKSAAIDKALAARIDHTLLGPTAAQADIVKVCEEAVVYGFRSVCVFPKFAPLCARLLAGSDVKIACVIGFPSGQQGRAIKVQEAKTAVKAGATELDLVAATGLLAEAATDPTAYARYHAEIEAVARAAKVPVKVILQTGLIREIAASQCGPGASTQAVEERGDALIRAASVLAATALTEAGVGGFVKTCDGVYAGKATARDCAIMAEAVGDFAGVKASGGVRSADDAAALQQAGADIFGTSGGVKLVTKQRSDQGY